MAGDKGMLFLNFGNREEAHRYFRNKILRKPHNRYQMKTFQVPKGFYDAVRSSAIDEEGAKENPEHGKVPVQVHQNVRGVLVEGQYGLPRSWILKLQKEIIQGTGKVILDHGPRKSDRR